MTRRTARTCLRMAASALSMALARRMPLGAPTQCGRRRAARACLAFQGDSGSSRGRNRPLALRSARFASGRAYALGHSRHRPSALGASMSWYENDDSGGSDWVDSSSPSSLPYSTTASAPAPPAAAADNSLSSKSSLPFQAPRTSFDDSLPSSLGGELSDGVLEWSKLGLLTELVDAVVGDPEDRRGLGLVDGPTPVQKMAIPEILAGCRERMASLESLKVAEERKIEAPVSSFDVDLAEDAPSSSVAREAAIPPVRSLAFAAATGSGKTLAYLLPIIQSLRAQELMAMEDDKRSMEALARLRRPRRPRALVLVPTRELARQILGVLKSVGHICKISSELLVGGDGYGKQRKRLADRPVDVLVATPGRLVKHRDAGDVFLGSVRHVVIDEMDTMLEQGFQNDIGRLLHPMLYKKRTIRAEEYKGGKMALVEGAPQVLLTTATMTPAVRRLLDKPELPFAPKKTYSKQNADEEEEEGPPDAVKIALPRDIRVLTAPGLHRVVPRLKQVFVNVGGTDKLSLMVDVVSGGERQKRQQPRGGAPLPLTLVFCNTVASCRAAEHALAESGVRSLSYHGDLSSDDREANLKAFRAAGEGGADRAASVLVCTDIASRGLDVPQVDHVVMFDFPLNSIDYLHRAGRTARGMASGAGPKKDGNAKRGEGKVTALVTKRDRVLASAIEGAVQRGESLEGLSSRKSDYAQGAKLGARTLGGGGGRGRGGSKPGRGRGGGGRSGRRGNSRRR